MRNRNSILIYSVVIMGFTLFLLNSCKKDDNNSNNNNSTPTGQVPVLTTTAILNPAPIEAISGGNITSIGSSQVTARGVCWSTNANPTIANNKTTDGTGTGNFTSTITGLTASTTYYVRSYATNSTGTGYGSQTSLTTPALFAVGQNYQGGIITHIYTPGQMGYIAGEEHGIIASNITTTAEWGCTGTDLNGADGFNYGDGIQNTLDILAGCQTPGIAAANASLPGGWFLPSFSELHKLFENKTAIGGFSGDYWSSSENDANTAEAICNTGGVLLAPKTCLFNVRAVKYF